MLIPPAQAQAPYPDPVKVGRLWAQDAYKILRLQEMALAWRGTVLEPYTVQFLAMLTIEDGSITAERRHDCHDGQCFGIGLQGHNICERGTPIVSQLYGKPFKKFCGKNAQKRFEAEYPVFSTDWRTQFAEYTIRQTNCINDGFSVEACMQAWNSNEVGRIAKVRRAEPFVMASLGISQE